ncbi:DUF222 domain-containing protein [Sinomonas sp. ASV322]|uniref:HNH endonuclease signature motif containing protein n=1 Tax=Sinomonas sp. ASV322 TaxID=3041920 RepID=UPI0027DCC65A|nr:DUF222 domain-containing protein [Sinomonas sp. ASV322]MDQ4502137.1 DUF222 domain-containing protein [Sinomonas sp. ASV322]
MAFGGRDQQTVSSADPLGTDGWDFRADPFAHLVDPPLADPALFESPEEDDGEADALWEAALSPTALMARARSQRADALVAELLMIDAEQARLDTRKAVVLAALTAAVGGSSENPVHRLEAPNVAASELAAAFRVSQRTASASVAEALAITGPVWRPVLDAMAAGDLPRRRATVILDAAAPVPRERLEEFAARAIGIACPSDPEQIPSQGALKRRLRRLADMCAGEPLSVRKERVASHRRVDLEPAQDGMCWLSAYLPLEMGAAIDTRLEAIARSLQGPEEQRTVNQLRADVFADLLAGGALAGGALAGGATTTEAPSASPPAGGVRTELIVTVPARTLSGDSDSPGEIVGYGAIDPNAARLLASEATTWTRLFVDPEDGAPLALGRRRYAPTLAMRRFLGARDRTCRFPGCDKPAAATEADHTWEWSEGGTTDTSNMALLCPQHHRLKTIGQWCVRQVDSSSPPGTLEWRAPSGRRYITYPEGDLPPPF